MGKRKATTASDNNESSTKKSKSNDEDSELSLENNRVFTINDILINIERQNFSRVGQAIAGPCTQMYRDILTSFIPHTELSEKVKHLPSRCPISKAQMQLIRQTKEEGYQNLDITIMYTLLRNVCNIQPTRQWGECPFPNHVTLSDDIERIRHLRNNAYSHVHSERLNDREYKGTWKQIQDIATRLKASLKQDYVTQINNLSTFMINEIKWKEMVDMMKKCLDTMNKMQTLQSMKEKDKKGGNKTEDKKRRKSFKHNSEKYTPDWAHNEIRIVLLGKTGSGKSSTGNTLLGRKRKTFKTDLSTKSVTKVCKKGQTILKNGKKVCIVDTPGFFDTHVPPEDLAKEISRCITMTTPGPHVFLYVQAFNRFTNEEANSVQEFFKCFGSEAEKFMILIFTGMDVLKKKKKKLSSFLKDPPVYLANLLKRCDYRYYGIDNENLDQNEVDTIYGGISSLISHNKDEWYTNEMYDENTKFLRQQEEKLAKEFDERHKDLLEKIEKAIEEKYNKHLLEYKTQLRKEMEEEIQKIKRRSKTDGTRMQEEIKKRYEEKYEKHINEVKSKIALDLREQQNQLQEEREKMTTELRQNASNLQSQSEKLQEEIKKSRRRSCIVM